MKRILLTGITLISALISFGQTQFEIVPDEKAKIVKGVITKEVLENDPAFSWFTEGQKNYQADAATAEAFKKNADKVELIVFGGTWCEDTQQLLPRLYKTVSVAGFPAEKITLFAVDRQKKTISHVAEAFGITNVPTFIVMKDGKEVGRVVEFGKTGMPDKELGEIIGNIQ